MTAQPLLVPMAADDPIAARLAAALPAELGVLETRRFPDGEIWLRHASSLAGRRVILLAALDRPDPKALPLLFAADAARELGAIEVGLVAPYLPYMRQDRRFSDGEAVTSTSFAAFLSRCVDWLVTVDPHLHRHAALSALYRVPAVAARAAPLLAAWIAREVPDALIIGPDVESEQWAAEVARAVGVPHAVLCKRRHGDCNVEIALPELRDLRGRTPVLVDDIISTGRTMAETVLRLRQAGAAPAVCMAVHAVFAPGAEAALRESGAARVVTSNTIRHPTNGFDVAGLLAEVVRGLPGDEPAISGT